MRGFASRARRRPKALGSRLYESLSRTFGISSLTLATPLAPGSPLCRSHAPGCALDGLEIALKGGQVGDPAYLSQVRDGGA